MQTINPALTAALVAMCVAVLMVQAGMAKRQLAWRMQRTRRPVLIVPPPPHAKGTV
jgi:hypothetical protein